VAVSTIEAEYRAVSSAAREALWLRQLLSEFDIEVTPMLVKCDSTGAIASIKNPKITQRTKHIDIAHHFVRERHLRGEILLEWISGKENVADVLTKLVPKDKHFLCCKGMGLINTSKPQYS
jgi:ATP sulfurylase